MDMLKALVPVEMTLASNVALRFLCNKADSLGIAVQPIHIEEPDNKAHSAQTGWIRKSWESGLRQAGMEEVQRILKSEKLDCMVMPNPIVRVGDREDNILEELRFGGYALFVEGEVSNFNVGEFRKRLRSKLYKQMPCPVLIVRNMVQSDRVALVVDEKTNVEQLVDRFVRYFAQSKVDFDLCSYAEHDLGGVSHPDEVLAEAKELLEEKGFIPTKALSLLSGPEVAAQALHDYGIIVANLDRKASRKSATTEVLGLVSSPLLLCW